MSTKRGKKRSPKAIALGGLRKAKETWQNREARRQLMAAVLATATTAAAATAVGIAIPAANHASDLEKRLAVMEATSPAGVARTLADRVTSLAKQNLGKRPTPTKAPSTKPSATSSKGVTPTPPQASLPPADARRIGEIAAKLTQQSDDLEDVSARLEEVAEASRDAKTEVSALVGAQAEALSELALDLSDVADALGGEIIRTQGDVVSVRSELTELTKSVEGATNEIVALGKRVDDTEDEVDAVGAAVDAAKSLVPNVFPGEQQVTLPPNTHETLVSEIFTVISEGGRYRIKAELIPINRHCKSVSLLIGNATVAILNFGQNVNMDADLQVIRATYSAQAVVTLPVGDHEVKEVVHSLSSSCIVEFPAIVIQRLPE